MEQVQPASHKNNKIALVVAILIVAVILVLILQKKGVVNLEPNRSKFTDEEKAQIMSEIKKSSEGSSINLTADQKAKILKDSETKSSQSSVNLTEEQKAQILSEIEKSN